MLVAALMVVSAWDLLTPPRCQGVQVAAAVAVGVAAPAAGHQQVQGGLQLGKVVCQALQLGQLPAAFHAHLQNVAVRSRMRDQSTRCSISSADAPWKTRRTCTCSPVVLLTEGRCPLMAPSTA